jgi:hypothetical protein
MAHSQYSTQEIVRRGEELYNQTLRPLVEAAHRGKFLVVDIDTGDYEIDPDEVVAVERSVQKNPDGTRYIKRIGYSAAHRIGGRLCPKP